MERKDDFYAEENTSQWGGQTDNTPKWYILGKDNKKFGKYTTQQMIDYFNQGKLNENSTVACMGMKAWTKFKDTELMQYINTFDEDEFIDEDFGGGYDQASNSRVAFTNNGYAYRHNNIVNDKPPFTAFEKLGIIGLSLIVGLVGLIVGIINIKYPSRRKFSIFLIVFYTILFIFMIGLFSSKKDTPKSNTFTSQVTDTVAEANTTEVVPQTKEIPTYHIGDVINCSTSEGDYNFSITGVSETTERNSYRDSEKGYSPSKVVLIDYSVENISYVTSTGDGLFIGDIHFDMYDADGNKLSTYPSSALNASRVSQGHKTTGQMCYELDNSKNYIEAEYKNNVWLGSNLRIDLEW